MLKEIRVSDIKQIESIANMVSGADTRVIDRTLMAGARVVERHMRSNLNHAVRGERSTGELVNSLGITPVKTSSRRGDNNVKIGFNEPRSHQYPATMNLRGRVGNSGDRRMGKRTYDEITNAMLGNVLEYGTSNQPARPWLTTAIRQSRKEMLESMERAFAEGIAGV